MRAAAAAIAFALPALALAQSGALNAAREAGARQHAATQARMNAADAALGDPAGVPGAATMPTEEDAAALDAAVDAAAVEITGDALVAGDVVGLEEGQTYTVVPGDTLWDISGRFLADPFLWPRIWSSNPQIANPHWIYPGNVLRIGPGGVITPVDAGDEPPAYDFGDIEAPRDLADFSKGEIGRAGLALEEADDVMVTGPRRIGFVPGHGTLTQRESFVTRLELAESGVLTAAFEDKLLLSVHDRAYAEFRGDLQVRPGETYAIYSTEREITHPVTGKPFGYRTRILGAGRVVSVEGKVAAIEIVRAYGPIERGSWLAPFAEKELYRVQQRPATKRIDGVIVASQNDVVNEIGQHHVVFVDKGTADGVVEGNVFTVLRSGDPYGKEMSGAREDENLPAEEIGALLVVDAKEHASTALVVRSARELFVGDRAVANAN